MVILIWLFVRDELSYNQFLPGYQDVYRVQLTIAEPGQRPVTWAATPDRMAAELKLDFPEIAAITRDAKQSVGMRHGEVSAAEAIEWVDADFLAVLGYPSAARRSGHGSGRAELDRADPSAGTEVFRHHRLPGTDTGYQPKPSNARHRHRRRPAVECDVEIRCTGVGQDRALASSPCWTPRRRC